MDISAIEDEVFTDFQKNVIRARLEGASYSAIQKSFNLSCPNVVERVLFRTLSGQRYDQGEVGRIPLIGDVQAQIFYLRVSESADELSSIFIHEAIKILEKITAEYLYRNYDLAYKLKCPSLAIKLMQHYENATYSNAWIKYFLEQHGMTIKSPQKLESLRRKYTHTNVITQFFSILAPIIPKDPRLLWNADETAITINKSGKVIVPLGKYPIAEEETRFGHFTLMCAFNADGITLMPFIVLPRLQKLPLELQSLQRMAKIASSASGWMTKKLFFCWAIHFVTEIEKYRMIQKDIGDREVFLFLDGHKSRLCSEAIELFCEHRIRVIIFPAHSTHCTQPFDVCIAGPFKTQLTKELKSIPDFINDRISDLNNTAKTRYSIVFSILNALQKVTTYRNCLSAFHKTGLYPFDLKMILQSPYVRPSSQTDVINTGVGLNINATEITTVEKRIEIARHCYPLLNISTINDIPHFEFEELLAQIYTGDEKMLHQYGPIPNKNPDGSWNL